jgi:hypothetical protein
MKTTMRVGKLNGNDSDRECWILVDKAPLDERCQAIADLARRILDDDSGVTLFGFAYDVLVLADPEVQPLEPEAPRPSCPEEQLSFTWCESCGNAHPPKGATVCDECISKLQSIRRMAQYME